jgi:hypothetical protein
MVQELKRQNRHIPALSIASAINERLNCLLPTFSSEGVPADRALMFSEAARRDTFIKWPHMNYKYVNLGLVHPVAPVFNVITSQLPLFATYRVFTVHNIIPHYMFRLYSHPQDKQNVKPVSANGMLQTYSISTRVQLCLLDFY